MTSQTNTNTPDSAAGKTVHESATAIAYDPYALPPNAIAEPPATLWKALRKIGPGIILAGTIVGSGELILTTSLGAKNGYVFLWLILFSCVIKVFVQIELGRYAISSAKPTLGALKEVPGGRWLVWWWFCMMICTVFQLGGMTGGVGQALNLAFPSFSANIASFCGSFWPALGTYIENRREFPWALATCFITMALIYQGGYRRIEWLSTMLVVGVTCLTVVAALALRFTSYPVHLSDLAEGLTIQIPAAGLGVAFAVFGITGVGATELFYYPYWCLEKGYARYVGRAEPTEEWLRRAQGWIRVMYLDAWVSMVVFTVSTIAFYLMGAAVLHPQGLDPKGNDLIDTLSKMYIGPFGIWTRVLFLIGAGAVLFKTLYLACAANSRLVVDFVSLVGLARAESPAQRAVWISRFCLFYPTLALVFFVMLRDPQLMVKIGGIAQATTLPMIALVSVYFRYTKLDPRLRRFGITDICLWIAMASILIVAMYAVPIQLGDLLTAISALFG